MISQRQVASEKVDVSKQLSVVKLSPGEFDRTVSDHPKDLLQLSTCELEQSEACPRL